MTDPDSNAPPEPPKDAPATPRRIARNEAAHPANAAPDQDGRERPRADARPDPRPPAAPGPRARPPKPDLRDLPPPRRDVPANVWRADPPAAPRGRGDAPRDNVRRDDAPRDGYRRDGPPASADPRDRREGPRRAWGDAPRADRPGERRNSPPPGRADGPWPGRDDLPGDRRDLPPEALGPQADVARPAFRRDDRRATGFPPGPPRDRAPDDRRPPQGGHDERRRHAGPRDDDRGPAGGHRDDRPRFDNGPRYNGPRDDGRGPQGGGQRDFDNSPRYQGSRDDGRGNQAGYRDERPRDASSDRPHYPSGPNERARPQGQHDDDRRHRRDDPRDDRRPPQPARPHADARPPHPHPRPAADPNEPRREDQRLSKVLAERGIASRREADDWIDAGWVKVDGEMAVLGARVFPHQTIEIDPLARTQQARRVTILLHKPIGYVSGQAEDGYEPASVLVTQANHWPEDPSRERWHPGHARGIAPAGRLDIDSTGMLVLTQDGRIARHLIGEDSDVEKEYLVRVEYPSGGQFPDNDLERLRHGLWLDGKELKPAKVSWANEDQLRFVLREGRKRQIRRMCEAVGLVVTGLKRVRIGSVVLGKLPQGQWRYLRDDERF